jgi:hypothetical protein
LNNQSVLEMEGVMRDQENLLGTARANVLAPVPRIGLNADDAARAIGLSKRQLFALKDAGELPYVEAGPQTFVFDPADLAAWLSKKKKTKSLEPTHGQR